MKIEYRTGDLFSTEIGTIVHGCNAQGVMGSGVARTIRDDYPKAYKHYRAAYQKDQKLEMGSVGFVLCPLPGSTSSDRRMIVNAITQNMFGPGPKRYVSYDAVAMAMSEINKVGSHYGIDTVAMPQIGAGLGGGDWNVIEAIIESEMTLVKPVVYILPVT